MRYSQVAIIDPVTSSSDQNYALVLGAANIDLCGHSKQTLTAQESNPGKLEISFGGVGRNIADNLARLGADTRLLSLVGDDHWGQQLLSATRLAGVNTDLCASVQDARTSSYLSLLNPDGEMQLALSDMDIIDRLDSTVLAACADTIISSEVLVLDSNLSEKALIDCFAFKHQSVFVDPVSSAKAIKLKQHLASIHTLKPNRQEAELLSGVKISRPSDVVKAANSLHDQGVINVFVSLGSEGGYWSTNLGANADVFAVPTVGRKAIVNVTGGGDALMAALAYSRLQKFDWRTTGKLAMAASAIAVAVESTINPKLSESLVMQVMEQNLC